MTRYEKLFVTLKYYLLGKGYFNALKALEYARAKYGNDMRKDKVTMSFSHPIEIALYIMTLKNVKNEELCLTAALLHDTVEDYPVSPSDIETLFGHRVRDIVWLVTKTYNGVDKDPTAYFDAIAQDQEASIVKLSDRVNNCETMVGVFTKDKQRRYLAEVEEKFFPMLKKAKTLYPEQSAAYFNIQHMLKSQIHLIKASLGDK